MKSEATVIAVCALALASASCSLKRDDGYEVAYPGAAEENNTNGSSVGGGTSSQTLVPQGTWGGRGALLVTSSAAAFVQLDCAHGETKGPLALDNPGDAQSGFHSEGSLTLEKGRARETGESNIWHAAKFSGKVENNKLRLSISYRDLEGKEVRLDHELGLGQEAQLKRCL